MNDWQESRFTPPSEWCPHPEWWHSADTDSTEIEVSSLVAAFVRALQPEFVVETGSAFGQTAELIGRALHKNGHGRLVTLEPDRERAAETLRRCEGLPVEVVQGRSLNWTPTEEIQFAWFDSLLNLRYREFQHFMPWVALGSIVGLHDTAPHHKIGDLIAAHPRLTAINLHTPRGVIFAQVS